MSEKETAELLAAHDEELSNLVEALGPLLDDTETRVLSKATELATKQAESIRAEMATKTGALHHSSDGALRLDLLASARAVRVELLGEADKTRSALLAGQEIRLAEIRPSIIELAKSTATQVTRDLASASPTISSLVKKEFDALSSVGLQLVNANKGNWDQSRIYEAGDIIAFRGSSYLVLRPNARGEYPSLANQKGVNPVYQILAAAGSPGPRATQDLTNVSGVLGVPNGGTGAASFTSTAVLLGGGTGAINASDLTYSTPTLSVPDAFNISSAGSIALTAGGSNKSITFAPTGTGAILVPLAGITPNAASLASGGDFIAVKEGASANFRMVDYRSSEFHTSYSGLAARGTQASPAFLANANDGDQMLGFEGFGWNGTGFTSCAAIRLYGRSQSASNLESLVKFYATPLNSTTMVEVFRMTSVSGSLLTGGAGNMTILAGSGASRTIIFQTTTSGSAATTALTLDATQGASFAGVIAAGGVAISASTAVGTPAGTTTVSSLRVPHGAAPTSPVNGDIWSTTTTLNFRLNGVTKSITMT